MFFLAWQSSSELLWLVVVPLSAAIDRARILLGHTAAPCDLQVSRNIRSGVMSGVAAPITGHATGWSGSHESQFDLSLLYHLYSAQALAKDDCCPALASDQ